MQMMPNSRSKAGKTNVGNFLHRLRTDALLLFALAAWLLTEISYFVPGLEWMRTGFEPSPFELLLLLLVSFLFLQATLRSAHRPARLFRGLLAIGYGFWFLGRLGVLLLPAGTDWINQLPVDLAYLLYYASAIVALELRLEASNESMWKLHYGTSAFAAVLLLFATFGYLSIIPLLAGISGYGDFFNLYIAVDFYLLIRCIAAAVLTSEKTWSRAYWALVAVFALILAVDTLIFLYRFGYLDYQKESSLNVLWTLWMGAAFFASRVRLGGAVNVTVASERAKAGVEQAYKGASMLLVFALALLMAHLVGYGFGWLDHSAEGPRAVFVFCWTLLVTALLLVFQWLMRKRVIESIRNLEFTELNAEKLELQLARSMAVGKLGQLSAAVAHDFGNTMTAISMHSEAIASQQNIGDIDRRDIEGVNRGVQHAQNLVDKLGRFGSARKPGSSSAIEMVAATQEALQLMRASLKPELRVSFRSSQSRIYAMANGSDVQTVLDNYLQNASDAATSAGDIRVAVREESLSGQCAACAARFSGKFVTLSVEDDGPGVSDEVIDNLFEPLVTTKDTGHGGGLGLATVSRIVHSLGGHVGMLQPIGGGSCFSAYFLASDAMSTET